MKTIILECSKYKNMDDFYNDIALQMNFPEYFGKNYDALKDCLSEVSEDLCNMAKKLYEIYTRKKEN